MVEKSVFDCETGGLNSQKSGLCSVTFKTKGRDDTFTVLIKPVKGLEYSEEALKVNGFTLEQLEEEGITEEEAVAKIKDYFKSLGSEKWKAPWCKPTMIGHNVKFDIGFVEALFQRHGSSFMDYIHYHTLDTMAVQLLMKGLEIYKGHVNLTKTYAYFFGKTFDNAHTSEADVLATEEVYDAQLDYFGKMVKFCKERKKEFKEFCDNEELAKEVR